MVSSCALYLDDLDLTGQKASVPDFLSALFQESDRVETRAGEGEVSVVYRATRATVLKRLSLMGCTEALSTHRFEEWRQDEIGKYLSAEYDVGEELAAIKLLSWEEWRRRVPEVLATRYGDESDRFADDVDRHMKDDDVSYSWLWFDGYDSLLGIRAIIDACLAIETVTLDVTPLISGGWLSVTEKVCADKIRVVSRRGQPAGPTIVLAEGRSDVVLFKAWMQRFHSDLSDFVTFLDHSEFRVDGGASFIVKFLRAFAAARVPANIVAVFDNDAAGRSAYQEAMGLQLPPNMVCIHLPDTNLARSYPTIGPQGFHMSDVNGKAAGLELYLGRDALSVDGSLRPVRWTGYDHRVGLYQGEVEEKTQVQGEFLNAMRESVAARESDFPELSLAWNTILQAAAVAGENSQSLARTPRGW